MELLINPKNEDYDELENPSFEKTQFLEPITNSEDMIDNLNEALERAVEEEEYEVAARLRDRIKIERNLIIS